MARESRIPPALVLTLALAIGVAAYATVLDVRIHMGLVAVLAFATAAAMAWAGWRAVRRRRTDEWTRSAQVLRERLAEAERESAQRIEAAFMGAVSAMATVVGQRDPYTAGHQKKVAALATAIARQMGYPEERIKGLALAASILDIGKIAVPAEILGRPGALTEAEADLVKGHAEAGYAVLKDLRFPWPIAEFILQHHERLDGSGYPRGLKGEAIVPEARILAVADSVAAMASHRPYRNAFPIDAVLSELSRDRGTRYDAGVVEACVRLFREKGYAFA